MQAGRKTAAAGLSGLELKPKGAQKGGIQPGEGALENGCAAPVGGPVAAGLHQAGRLGAHMNLILHHFHVRLTGATRGVGCALVSLGKEHSSADQV